jgi:hypothetical protein
MGKQKFINILSNMMRELKEENITDYNKEFIIIGSNTISDRQLYGHRFITLFTDDELLSLYVIDNLSVWNSHLDYLQDLVNNGLVESDKSKDIFCDIIQKYKMT